MLSAVYATLAKALPEVAVTYNESIDDNIGTRGYTEADVRILKNAVDNTAVRAFLTYLAQHAPDTFGFHEIVELTGRPHNGLRADLAGLTKTIKRVTGFEDGAWPVVIQDPENGECTYTMSRLVANWWLTN